MVYAYLFKGSGIPIDAVASVKEALAEISAVQTKSPQHILTDIILKVMVIWLYFVYIYYINM